MMSLSHCRLEDAFSVERGIICCTYTGAKFPEEYNGQWRLFIPTTITRNKANCNYVVTKAMERKNNDDDTKKKIMTIDDEGDITFTWKIQGYSQSTHSMILELRYLDSNPVYMICYSLI